MQSQPSEGPGGILWWAVAGALSPLAFCFAMIAAAIALGPQDPGSAEVVFSQWTLFGFFGPFLISPLIGVAVTGLCCIPSTGRTAAIIALGGLGLLAVILTWHAWASIRLAYPPEGWTPGWLEPASVSPGEGFVTATPYVFLAMFQVAAIWGLWSRKGSFRAARPPALPGNGAHNPFPPGLDLG